MGKPELQCAKNILLTKTQTYQKRSASDKEGTTTWVEGAESQHRRDPQRRENKVAAEGVELTPSHRRQMHLHVEQFSGELCGNWQSCCTTKAAARYVTSEDRKKSIGSGPLPLGGD